jgi:hypothetical protein
MRLNSVGAVHLNPDPAISLRNVDHLVPKQHFDIRKLSEALKKDLGGLELLALNDEWVICVTLENDVIELGDLLPAWPIPELEDRRHQPDAGHLVRKTIICE